MNVPHVPRVTVPDKPPASNGRVAVDPPISIRERLEDLQDSVATSNRASLNLLHQMEALRFAVIFAGVLLAAYIIFKRES